MAGLTTIYTFFLSLVMLVMAGMGFVSLLRNRRHLYNQLLVILCVAGVAWCTTFLVRYGLLADLLELEKADYFLWAKVSHVAGAVLFSFASYFLLVFPDRRASPLPSWLTVLFVGVIPGAICALVFADLIVEDMRRVGHTYFIAPGRLHSLWAIYSVSYLLIGLSATALKYRRITGRARLQLQYVVLGVATTTLIGTATNVVLPSLSRVFPGLVAFSGAHLIGPLTLLFFLIGVTIAIVRHRLLEIEAAIVRTLAYSGASVLLVGGYVALVVLAERALRGLVEYGSLLVSAIAALAVALLFQPVRQLIQQTLQRRLFASRLGYQEQLRRSIHELVTRLDLDDMANYIVETIYENLGASRVAFHVRQHRTDNRAFSLVAQRTATESSDHRDLVDTLVDWLQTRKDVIVREELEYHLAPEAFEELRAALVEVGVEVLVPVFVKGELEAVLAIDGKVDHRSFSTSDIELLSLLAAQAAIAIVNARLYDEAITDGLTGLFNRRYFDQRLREELLRARRFGRALALLMIDADHFKRINDEHGHLTGDAVLKQIGALVRSTVREMDIVCRYGGEEFAVILPEAAGSTDLEGEGRRGVPSCEAVAERIRAAVAAHPLAATGLRLEVTVSVGASYSDDLGASGINEVDMVRAADAAMYVAKQTGRDRVAVYEATQFVLDGASSGTAASSTMVQ